MQFWCEDFFIFKSITIVKLLKIIDFNHMYPKKVIYQKSHIKYYLWLIDNVKTFTL